MKQKELTHDDFKLKKNPLFPMIYMKLIQRCKGLPAMAQRIMFAAQTLELLWRSSIWIGACVANPRRV